MAGLFATKSLNTILAEAQDRGEHSRRRALGLPASFPFVSGRSSEPASLFLLEPLSLIMPGRPFPLWLSSSPPSHAPFPACAIQSSRR
jgi:hypothetical protein